MSQKRTVFPGMEQVEGTSTGGRREGNDAYRGDYGGGGRHGGTRFPGMEDMPSGGAGTSRRETGSRQGGRPLVGFLYSVSRTGYGEYWPLYIGANTIGRSSKCSVILAEGTVSSEHAELVVRWMKNPQRLDVSISDERSSNGTLVNGESVPSTRPLECHNGDIITIGVNYQLLLIVVDTKELGLAPVSSFVAQQVEEGNSTPRWDTEYDRGRTRDEEDLRGSSRWRDTDYPPHFTGGHYAGGDYTGGASEGTRGMDGDNAPRRGGTVGNDEGRGSRRGGTSY